MGELQGRAVPLAFCFTASISGSAAEGAKERLVHTVIRYVAQQCQNIAFTLSDKDITEINAFRVEIPQARHQLCYWHAIRYIEERLAENKPPSPYSAIRAHEIFDFIDPTWVPGISSESVQDGVHSNDLSSAKGDFERGTGTSLVNFIISLQESYSPNGEGNPT